MLVEVPLQFPLHITCVSVPISTSGLKTCPIVTTLDLDIQPPFSVTVTVYVPGPNPVAVADVPPFGHQL